RIDALSAHADCGDILRWLGGLERPPRVTYLVHREPDGARGLAAAIGKRYGWNVKIAADGETVELNPRPVAPALRGGILRTLSPDRLRRTRVRLHDTLHHSARQRRGPHSRG